MEYSVPQLPVALLLAVEQPRTIVQDQLQAGLSGVSLAMNHMRCWAYERGRSPLREIFSMGLSLGLRSFFVSAFWRSRIINAERCSGVRSIRFLRLSAIPNAP